MCISIGKGPMYGLKIISALGKGGNMKLFITCICLVILIASAGIAAASDAVIGSVKKAKGDSYIIRDGKSIPAKIGEKLLKNDVLETGADGAMGVVFKDDTLLSLGPESRIILDEFIFEPAEGKFSIVTKMAAGTAAYVSGNIVKKSPDAARFETPLATLGIRGTKFVVSIEGGK